MIKEEIVEYRNQNPETRTLLGTVIGELDRITKTPTDEQCIQVIKKMVESNVECGQLEENLILRQFLPRQMTEIDIKELIEVNQFKSIKDCMDYFKKGYLGQYDGKLVSKLFNTK